MPNNWFRFKQFTIQQERAAMKVGTDGVLLGSWASVPEPGQRVLDAGTGTGLIALMIAQRSVDTWIDALEIDPSSAGQADENFQNSPWNERLTCIHSSLQDYASRCSKSYDLLICNPPFFSASSKTSSREKNLARHDDALSLSDLFKTSRSLVKESALLSLIIPAHKEAEASDLAHEHHFSCRRLTRVRPTPGKPVNRMLLEFSSARETCVEEELTIEMEGRHLYSEAYKALTKEFYL